MGNANPTDIWAIRDLARRARRHLIRSHLRAEVMAALATAGALALPLLICLCGLGLALGYFPWEVAGAALTALVATCLVRSLVRVWRACPTPLAASKLMDDHGELSDHLSSALSAVSQVPQTNGDAHRGPGQQAALALLIRRAAHQARVTDLDQALPTNTPHVRPALALIALTALVLAVTIHSIPFESVATAAIVDMRLRDIIRAAIEGVSRSLEDRADRIEEQAAETDNPEGQKLGAELRRVADDLRRNDPSDRRAAVQKLAEAERSLEDRRLPKSFDEAVAKAAAALQRSKHTRGIGRELEEQRFTPASREAQALARELPDMKLGPKETDELRNAAAEAAEALAGTRLDDLAQNLAEIAKALEKGDPSAASKKLEQLAEALGRMEQLAQTQRLLGQALDALRDGRRALAEAGGAGASRQGQELPFMDLKLPPGPASDGSGEGEQRPMPVLPGPIRPGGGQGGGDGEQPPLYEGPCSFDCPFEGQCIKCPCRGKQLCPPTGKTCECRTCMAAAGGGGSGAGQGAMPVPGSGQGGLEPGWGSVRGEQDSSERAGRSRRTRVAGIIGEKGESAIMAVKSANDGSRAGVGYADVYSDYRRVAEESLHRERVPLSRREHVRRYFDSIKPPE